MTEPHIVCNLCASKYRTSYHPCATLTRMERDGICFGCAHWELQAERYQSGASKMLVIEGGVYSVGREPSPEQLRRNSSEYGMAGRRFDIVTDDGRSITTHNLWSGGAIPERWLPRMPNNALFEGGAGSSVIGGVRYHRESATEQKS